MIRDCVIFTFWQTLPRTWYVDEQIKRHMYLIHRRFPFPLSPQGGVWWCSFSSLKQYVALLGPGLSPQMLFSFAFSRDLLSLFLFFVVYGLELGSSLQGKTWRYFMVNVWVSGAVRNLGIRKWMWVTRSRFRSVAKNVVVPWCTVWLAQSWKGDVHRTLHNTVHSAYYAALCKCKTFYCDSWQYIQEDNYSCAEYKSWLLLPSG